MSKFADELSRSVWQSSASAKVHISSSINLAYGRIAKYAPDYQAITALISPLSILTEHEISKRPGLIKVN